MGIMKPNISKLEKEGNIEGLIKHLSNKRADVRLKAFSSLYKQAKNDDYILNRLLPLVEDPDAKVKTSVILNLAVLGVKEIVESIRYIIIKGSKSEKIEALRIIADKYSVKDKHISNILALALNDKTAMVQLESIRSMGKMKDESSIYYLSDMLYDRRHTIRYGAVNALGAIGTSNTIDHLIGALMDKHIDVRKAAEEALVNIGSERALKAINDAPFMLLVKRMNTSVSSRQETIRHIGKQKIIQGLPLLRKACGDDYKNVRIEAIRAIGVMKDKSSIPIITKATEDAYYDVRLEAVRTLEKLVDKTSLPPLEKAMEDYNHHVREEAKRAYYHLLDRFDRLEKRKMNK